MSSLEKISLYFSEKKYFIIAILGVLAVIFIIMSILNGSIKEEKEVNMNVLTNTGVILSTSTGSKNNPIQDAIVGDKTIFGYLKSVDCTNGTVKPLGNSYVLTCTIIDINQFKTELTTVFKYFSTNMTEGTGIFFDANNKAIVTPDYTTSTVSFKIFNNGLKAGSDSTFFKNKITKKELLNNLSKNIVGLNQGSVGNIDSNLTMFSSFAQKKIKSSFIPSSKLISINSFGNGYMNIDSNNLLPEEGYIESSGGVLESLHIFELGGFSYNNLGYSVSAMYTGDKIDVDSNPDKISELFPKIEYILLMGIDDYSYYIFTKDVLK